MSCFLWFAVYTAVCIKFVRVKEREEEPTFELTRVAIVTL